MHAENRGFVLHDLPDDGKIDVVRKKLISVCFSFELFVFVLE